MKNVELDFSLPAIRYAIDMCQEYPQYHVGIVVDADADFAHAKKMSCGNMALEYVDVLKFDGWRKPKVGAHTIRFKNGSAVYITTSEDTARGYLWNMLICEPTLDKKAHNKARCWLRAR